MSSRLFHYQIVSVSCCVSLCFLYLFLFFFLIFPLLSVCLIVMCIFIFEIFNVNSISSLDEPFRLLKQMFILFIFLKKLYSTRTKSNGKHVHCCRLNHKNLFILFHSCEVLHLNEDRSTAIIPGLARLTEWLSQSNTHLIGHFELLQTQYYLIHLM